MKNLKDKIIEVRIDYIKINELTSEIRKLNCITLILYTFFWAKDDFDLTSIHYRIRIQYYDIRYCFSFVLSHIFFGLNQIKASHYQRSFCLIDIEHKKWSHFVFNFISEEWVRAMNARHTSCVTLVARDTYPNPGVPIRSATLTWWPPGILRRAPCFASTTRRWSSAWRSTRGGLSGRRTSTSPGSWRLCRFVIDDHSKLV